MPDDDTLTEESRRTGTHGRSPLTWLVTSVVVLVIAGAAAFALLDRESDKAGSSSSGTSSGVDAPDTVELVAEPPSQRCMLPEVGVLRQQELAFDGVVRSVAGGDATLVPTRFYVGDEADVVVVNAPSGDLQALLAAVDFREGERYLVSATDARVTVCGFSGPYSAELAQLYERAYGG